MSNCEMEAKYGVIPVQRSGMWVWVAGLHAAVYILFRRQSEPLSQWEGQSEVKAMRKVIARLK